MPQFTCRCPGRKGHPRRINEGPDDLAERSCLTCGAPYLLISNGTLPVPPPLDIIHLSPPCTTTSLRPRERNAGAARHAALDACAEFLAELVRSDQVFGEQADEARDLLAKANVEV